MCALLTGNVSRTGDSLGEAGIPFAVLVGSVPAAYAWRQRPAKCFLLLAVPALANYYMP